MVTDALRVQDLDAFYGDTQILRQVSFRLGTGSVLGVLGRNGVGKSTCIGAIAGLVSAQAQELTTFGHTLIGLSPEQICRHGIGLVPQGRRVFATLTTEENLVVATRGQQPRRWSITEVVKLFPRLGERLRQLAGTLSGGEQQMLAIARALVTNPRVLLLDEPSEGLAPMIVTELMHTISELKSEGMSIILVEQNLGIARALADEVVVISTGQVAFSGDAKDFAQDERRMRELLGIF